MIKDTIIFICTNKTTRLTKNPVEIIQHINRYNELTPDHRDCFKEILDYKPPSTIIPKSLPAPSYDVIGSIYGVN